MELKNSVRTLFLALALTGMAAPSLAVQAAPSAQAAKPVVKPVNINTADAPALAEGLKGVGLAKAEAIIAYRKANGPFKSAEQLAEVKGIGDKLVQNNRDRIVVK